MATTRNIGILKANPGTETIETLSEKFNDLAEKLDVADHSVGKGVTIKNSGITINDNLSLNDKGLLRAAFSNFHQVASDAEFDALPNSTIYVRGNGLYFKSGTGVSIPITDANSLLSGTGSGAPTFSSFTSFVGTKLEPLRMQATFTGAFLQTFDVRRKVFEIPDSSVNIYLFYAQPASEPDIISLELSETGAGNNSIGAFVKVSNFIFHNNIQYSAWVSRRLLAAVITHLKLGVTRPDPP